MIVQLVRLTLFTFGDWAFFAVHTVTEINILLVTTGFESSVFDSEFKKYVFVLFYLNSHIYIIYIYIFHIDSSE